MLRKSTVMLCCAVIVALVNSVMMSSVQAQGGTDFDSVVYQISIPADIGTVEDRWVGSSGKTLILLQDAHISLEVQLNIAKIIDRLVTTYDVSLVNIEGADHEKIDFNELRNLEPRDIVSKVSIEFLKECRINGAVYAKINNEKDFVQYGTEDKDAYLENYKRYLGVMENNEAIQSYLMAVRNDMMKKKKKFLSQDLVEVVNVDLLFKENDTSLISYFKVMLKYAQKLNIDLIAYTSISQLLEVVFSEDAEERFKSVDSEALLDELMALNKEIKKRLATNLPAQNFMDLFDRILLLQDMCMLKIVPSDYARYLQNKEMYRSVKMGMAIQKVFPAYDITPLNEINTLLTSADEFYEHADERSRIIFKNSMSNFDAEGADVAVIVSGGFHTEELVKLCRDHNVSYVRIMPLVTSDEESVDYAGRMLALKSELITDEITTEKTEVSD